MKHAGNAEKGAAMAFLEAVCYHMEVFQAGTPRPANVQSETM